MNTIPYITTVAELQKGFRFIANKTRLTGEPVVVVSNGKPDVVIMDVKLYNTKALRLRELEEELLLKKGEEALDEYRTGKSVRLSKGKTLEEILDA